jgi:hypothetical protein
MSPADKNLLKQIASWPEADQQEIAEVAREIESPRTGLYRLSDAERAAVREGIEGVVRRASGHGPEVRSGRHGEGKRNRRRTRQNRRF